MHDHKKREQIQHVEIDNQMYFEADFEYFMIFKSFPSAQAHMVGRGYLHSMLEFQQILCFLS